jgi:hypothetical protein
MFIGWEVLLSSIHEAEAVQERGDLEKIPGDANRRGNVTPPIAVRHPVKGVT